jgi:hypothetical protein
MEEQDNIVLDIMAAKNRLENFPLGVKSQISDEKNADKFSEDKKIEEIVQ